MRLGLEVGSGVAVGGGIGGGVDDGVVIWQGREGYNWKSGCGGRGWG